MSAQQADRPADLAAGSPAAAAHSDAAHAARSVVDGVRVCEYALYKKGQRFYLKVVNPDDGPD